MQTDNESISLSMSEKIHTYVYLRIDDFSTIFYKKKNIFYILYSKHFKIINQFLKVCFYSKKYIYFSQLLEFILKNYCNKINHAILRDKFMALLIL